MVAADPSQKTTYHPPSIISRLLELFMRISAPNDVQKQINKTKPVDFKFKTDSAWMSD
jgi:hypothetical protein